MRADPVVGARRILTNRGVMLSALGVLFGTGDGFRQLCRVLGMKVTAPRRAGYKAGDLVGMVHRSSLLEAVAVGGVPAEASKWGVECGAPGCLPRRPSRNPALCSTHIGKRLRDQTCGLESLLWRLLCARVCSHVHVYLLACELLAPDAPENYLVSFSEVHRNPGATEALLFRGKDAGVRVPAPGRALSGDSGRARGWFVGSAGGQGGAP